MPTDVRIPLAFLRDIVPTITNQDELHTTLAVFRLAAELGSEETPIAETSIMADTSLRATLKVTGSTATLDRRIFDALELAVGRNTLLRFVARNGTREAAWYYINTPVTRSLVLAMQRRSIPAPTVVWDGNDAPQIAIDPPNAFRLYEQNIGPLTPIVADQIITAASEYPADWIEDAIGEAVSYNKRNWRYIQRILENWKESGRAERD